VGDETGLPWWKPRGMREGAPDPFRGKISVRVAVRVLCARLATRPMRPRRWVADCMGCKADVKAGLTDTGSLSWDPGREYVAVIAGTGLSGDARV